MERETLTTEQIEALGALIRQFAAQTGETDLDRLLSLVVVCALNGLARRELNATHKRAGLIPAQLYLTPELCRQSVLLAEALSMSVEAMIETSLDIGFRSIAADNEIDLTAEKTTIN